MMWFKSREQRRREQMTPEQMREESERVARYAGEQLQRRPSKVEALARAYCEEMGYNPDDPVPGHMGARRWMRYRDIAEAALHKTAMDNALRKVAQLPKDTATS